VSIIVTKARKCRCVQICAYDSACASLSSSESRYTGSCTQLPTLAVCARSLVLRRYTQDQATNATVLDFHFSLTSMSKLSCDKSTALVHTFTSPCRIHASLISVDETTRHLPSPIAYLPRWARSFSIARIMFCVACCGMPLNAVQRPPRALHIMN
jgi:hypothetical protein